MSSLASLMLLIAQLLLLLALAGAVWRLLRGPAVQDRVVALDACYTDGLLLMLAIALRTGSILYVEMALIIALFGFITTMAFAKFLLRGEVIE
ncbi:MAG: K+/H+ antiporter subunit F [Nevskiaceae bacterium]|nr:MAG: K+/H+ antiporter subunit F [Nevskiaceae bacterium]TBR72822.1 MAG: K+/H+ antiporter subunit F [Nevskiaceae bacterium]